MHPKALPYGPAEPRGPYPLRTWRRAGKVLAEPGDYVMMAGPPGQGDAVAIESVLAGYGAGLLRVALAYARDAADAQDLYQDICYAIWKALPRFRGEASLRTFVWRIAHNRGLSHRARGWRGPEKLELDVELPDPGPAADELVAERQRNDRLFAAVRALPEAGREVVLLALEGLTHGEIAEVLGITENAVAVRLTRARDRLRAQLDPKAFDR